MPKHHFMIDLETMSTRPNAAIVSVGIVHFDAGGNALDKFYTPVGLQSCIDHGLHVEQSTIEWWNGQPAEVKAHWDVATPPDLAEAMKATQDWLYSKAGGRRNVCPWGNGADFDMPILRNGFNALEAEEPWMFYNVHCYRTIKNLFPLSDTFKPARTGAHKADDDAEFQVAGLRAIMAQYSISLLSFGG